MTEVLKMRFLVRSRTAAEWTALNEILLASTSGTGARELGMEEDTGKFKLGDGVTPWIGLAYFSSGVQSVTGTGVDNTDPLNPVITGGSGGGGDVTLTWLGL